MAREVHKPDGQDGWQGENPRIDPNEPMSVEGFRSSHLVLGALNQDDPDIQEYIKKSLEWAEGLDPNAVITWELRNGQLKPVAHSSFTLKRKG